MPKTIEVIDVGGSFKKFLKRAPIIARQELQDSAVAVTAAQLADRMRAGAPVDPNTPPHMRDAIGYEVHGLSAEAGVLDSEQADVALYNEYSPNHQPFMMPAALQEETPFRQRATKALKRMESLLTI